MSGKSLKNYTFYLHQTKLHCVKNVEIRSLFWSVFSHIRSEYGEILCISPFSVQMWENADQKKLPNWTLFRQCSLEAFLRSSYYCFKNSKSLKDHLVRAVLPQLDRQDRSKAGEGANRSCEVCELVNDTTKF